MHPNEVIIRLGHIMDALADCSEEELEDVLMNIFIKV
jgi:hypothetical protein